MHLEKDLHSNMVRFIIFLSKNLYCLLYGYLHSNMVRFIITTGFMSRGVQINLHSNMVRFIIRRNE